MLHGLLIATILVHRHNSSAYPPLPTILHMLRARQEGII